MPLARRVIPAQLAMTAPRVRLVMVLPFPSVTAPFRASARPMSTTLSLSVMLVKAMMFPFHWLPTPRVAELPTHQYTFFACAPFWSNTFPAVVSVEGARITNSALLSPLPSSVTVPVTPTDDPEQ